MQQATELYQRLFYQAEQADKARKNSVLAAYHQGRYDSLKHVLMMLEDIIRTDAMDIE